MQNKRFNMSQAAHKRLARKYSKLNGKRSRKLKAYHMDVFTSQNMLGSVLSKKSKKEKYNLFVGK